MDNTPNPQIELAFDYVHKTNKHIFLTGKAGTGKTTFLRKIRRETIKRTAVVAPTGVAAINAEGVTIHSLFQLPFGTFLPGQIRQEMSKRRFSGKKIKLIKSLDLLIIDEISMVRADVLDAIDEVLRRYRNFALPFGGVQLLMIGDLHQLPPVIKQEDWEQLKEHYKTLYFFGSLALQKSQMVTIELKHIYRQSDHIFIELLNKVRSNQMGKEVLDILNSRYQPDFKPKDEDGYITLTSHNRTSQAINIEKLHEIEKPPYFFKAGVDGDFPEKNFPTEKDLILKIGAQVMFIKNDLSGEQLYYNGKIGQVMKIGKDKVVYVRCPGDRQEIAVTPVEWHNRKFTLNEKTKEVQEDIIGTFTQHPLKLAWAITIHKSQGLTFERVIIDAQAAFAHGQVYVALSRCKSFEGIVLRSQIISSSVKTDRVVQNYSLAANENAPGEKQLEIARHEYQQELLRDLFSFKRLQRNFDQLRRVVLENENALQGNIVTASATLEITAREKVTAFAEKFLPQLETYLRQAALPEENKDLQERLRKASAYFSKQLKEVLLPAINGLELITDNQAVEKKAIEKIAALKNTLLVKYAGFMACREEFKAQTFIRAIVDAELSGEKRTSSKKPPAVKMPKDSSHPDLYQKLSEWRAAIADDKDVPRYAVMTTRSLLEIVEVLPTSSASLKRIKGIGKGRADKFGADILELVIQYCQEQKLPTDQLQFATGKESKKPKTAKVDTKTVSYDLYRSGKSIAEIATIRSFSPTTIEGHLSHYITLGDLEVAHFVEQKKIETIENVFSKSPDSSFSEIKQAVGADISYGEIRMVLAYLKHKAIE